jgi:UDP-N-acetylmuramate dehydrogenase
MAIAEHVALKPFNTFGVAAAARFWVAVDTPDALLAVLDDAALAAKPRLILGGGSNILFTRDFDGLVIKNDIRGLTVVRETPRHAWVRAGAGEDWDAFVRWSLRRGYYGLENLALIPGAVGASPVQNIGAYGVEVASLLETVEAIEMATGRRRRFDVSECGLGYRTSIFKQAPRDRFFISAVTFRLAKKARPVTTYADVRQALERAAVDPVTPEAVSTVVRDIRRRKLPDPQKIGNAGSFFKNPVLDAARFAALAADHPAVPHFPLSDGRVKVAGGWLIEQCGWKGKRIGACGVYPHQALVLVNYGGARGQEILQLANAITESVQAAFGLALEPEPRIV